MKEMKINIGFYGKIPDSSKLFTVYVNNGALQLNIKELAKNIFSDNIKFEKEEDRVETSTFTATEFIEEEKWSIATEFIEEEKWSTGKTVENNTGDLDEKGSCLFIYVNVGCQIVQDDNLPEEKESTGEVCIIGNPFNGWPLVFIPNFGLSLNNLTVAASNTTIQILLFTVIILIQPARCWYCGIPRASVEIVVSCPLTQGEWNQRSVAKNCTSFYQQSNCSSPETYIYHCVITPFKNGTVEVCAQKAIINFGYCAEYDNKGQLIQENYGAKCQQCPQRYLSWDAYKYQECYNMTQKKEETMTTETHSKSVVTTTSIAITATTASFPSQKRRNTTGSLSAILIGLLSPVIITCCIIFAYMYKKKICVSKPKEIIDCRGIETVETESPINDDIKNEVGKPFLPVQNNPEKCEVVPSGQSLSHNEVSNYSQWTEGEKGIMLASGQRYTNHMESGPLNRQVLGYLDEEDVVAPDISVRDKERFHDDDQDGQSIKDEAVMTLNNGMINLAYVADKDDRFLQSLLEYDEYKAVIEEIEDCRDTDFTSEKAPLLRNYAERIQDIVKRSAKPM